MLCLCLETFVLVTCIYWTIIFKASLIIDSWKNYKSDFLHLLVLLLGFSILHVSSLIYSLPIKSLSIAEEWVFLGHCRIIDRVDEERRTHPRYSFFVHVHLHHIHKYSPKHAIRSPIIRLSNLSYLSPNHFLTLLLMLHSIFRLIWTTCILWWLLFLLF